MIYEKCRQTQRDKAQGQPCLIEGEGHAWRRKTRFKEECHNHNKWYCIPMMPEPMMEFT